MLSEQFGPSKQALKMKILIVPVLLWQVFGSKHCRHSDRKYHSAFEQNQSLPGRLLFAWWARPGPQQCRYLSERRRRPWFPHAEVLPILRVGPVWTLPPCGLYCPVSGSLSVMFCFSHCSNAYNLVQARRFCINPNEGFVQQLREYEPIYRANESIAQCSYREQIVWKRKREICDDGRNGECEDNPMEH